VNKEIKELLMKLHEQIDALENDFVEITNKIILLYEKLNDKEGQNHLILVKILETIGKDSKSISELGTDSGTPEGIKRSPEYH
jgi:uncharacterized coiled-coil DUF342 family protein